MNQYSHYGKKKTIATDVLYTVLLYCTLYCAYDHSFTSSPQTRCSKLSVLEREERREGLGGGGVRGGRGKRGVGGWGVKKMFQMNP